LAADRSNRKDTASAERLSVDQPSAIQEPWRKEGELTREDLLIGLRIRHRTRGIGTVLAVKPTPKGAEILARFDDGGEAWLAFGLGVLEYRTASTDS
jgi:hypothetical protein